MIRFLDRRCSREIGRKNVVNKIWRKVQREPAGSFKVNPRGKAPGYTH